MIIDLILDRKDGANRAIKDGKLYITPIYNPKQFYNDVSKYAHDLKDYRIPEMLDNGTEEQVKEMLCDYVIEYGYRDKITDFINSVKWL